MKKRYFSDNGVSEQAAITLILILVIGLAGVIAAVIFGIINPVSRTGYLVPKAELTDVSGYQAIQLRSLAGDTFSLNGSGKESGYYRLGTRLDTSTGSRVVQVSQAISNTDFRPGDTLYIYQSGTTPVLTDRLAGVTPTGNFPEGNLVLTLHDDTSHVLLARIALAPGAGGSISPSPTITPIPASSVYLNADKNGYLTPGGILQFQVTDSNAWVAIDGTTYWFNVGDTVRLVTGSATGTGHFDASSSQITQFSFSDISVYDNGVLVGHGSIPGSGGIFIGGYSNQVSSLSLTVPGTSAWTDFKVDSSAVISGGNSSAITLAGIGGPSNLDLASGHVWYVGGVSGYNLS